jgi:PAS domain S-box-containing protein
MEDELARRERDFRTLAENAPDPIIRYDRQGLRIYINSIVEKVNNTPSTALLGQTPSDKQLLGKSDSEKVRSSIERVIETGEREVLEVLYSSPDGRERWLQTILVPEFGQDNRVESVLLIGRDIHEMKLHEQHLEQTLQFTDKIIDSIPEPVFIKDRQHRFILSNEAHCIFRSMDRDEFIGKTDFDHFPELDAQAFWEAEEEIFETGKDAQYDDYKVDKLGNRTYFVLHKACFIGADGNKYLAGMVHFITERKIAEEKLRESEMQYRTLVENSPDVIVRYDRDCNRLFFNPAFQELSAYQVSELIGTSPNQLSPLSGHQANLYLNTIKKVFESALSQSMEIQVYTPDNDFWYNMKAVPEFDEEGNVASVLAIGHDVTELKKSKQMSEMLSHALNKASDSFFIFKVGNPKFTYVNEQVYKSLGYAKEELDAMTLFDIDPLMDFEKLTALDSLLAQQPVVTIEAIHKKKDGTIFPVENTISYYRYRETNYVFILSRDITERKQAEQVLQEERQLFIGGPNVAFKWKASRGWPIEYVSPNIHEQFGYQAIELTESAALFLNLVHPNDLEKIIGDASEHNQSLEPFLEQEFRIINAKGEYRWVYAFTVPVRGNGNEISHYKGYLTDISNRKHSEQALIDSELRYRLVFENSPVSIWEEDFSRVVALFDELKLKRVVDLERYIELHPEFVEKCAENISITDVNNSALNLHYAKSKKELIENFAGTFTDESIEAFKKELVHIWNGGTEMKIDTEVKTFTGEIRNVTVYFTVCPGYEDSLSKILVSIIDITERKLAEDVIVQLNADLNATLMAIPDMLFEINASGAYINVWAKKENHLLLDRDRLIGQSVFEVLPPHALEIVSQSMAETIEKGYSYGNIYYLDIESERKWFELSVSKKTIFRTSEIQFIALVRDITDRKRVEEALLESQKRLIKAELIASIGHFEYDYKYGMSYWSEGALEILSTPEALRNSESPVFLEMVVHQEDSKRVQTALEDALKNNTKFDETYRIIDFVGNEKVIHSTGQVLVSNEGVSGNFFGIIQDVTMVYLLNNKLIAEEEKFRQLAENSPVGIFILKRETPLYANKPMMSMLEIESAEQLTIINILKLIHPDDRSKFQPLSKMLRNENYNKTPYRFAIRKVCLNGRIRHFDVQTTLFNVQGEDLIQFIVIDKTEDYENEQIRQQLAASTLYIDQKNKFTSEIESRLKIILSSNKKIEKADFQPIIEVIRTYSQTDKDWELLRTHIDNIHPDFVVKLKSYCNTLSINDIKHCSCIRLNLDTKEIARFFNVKPSSIQTSRVRLKKKFQLPDSIDLREFILGI